MRARKVMVEKAPEWQVVAHDQVHLPFPGGCRHVPHFHHRIAHKNAQLCCRFLFSTSLDSSQHRQLGVARKTELQTSPSQVQGLFCVSVHVHAPLDVQEEVHSLLEDMVFKTLEKHFPSMPFIQQCPAIRL